MARAFYSWQAGDWTQILQRRGSGRTSLWEQHRATCCCCCFFHLSLSLSPSLQAFTRETKRLDQMGSVIGCYYSTDRVHFSSWPYLKERVESSLLSQNSGDMAQDEFRTMIIASSLIFEAYQHSHCSFLMLGTVVIVPLPVVYRGWPSIEPQHPTDGKH